MQIYTNIKTAADADGGIAFVENVKFEHTACRQLFESVALWNDTVFGFMQLFTNKKSNLFLL